MACEGAVEAIDDDMKEQCKECPMRGWSKQGAEGKTGEQGEKGQVVGRNSQTGQYDQQRVQQPGAQLLGAQHPFTFALGIAVTLLSGGRIAHDERSTSRMSNFTPGIGAPQL